tara:strand:- start:2577 stop:2924 length:348 start_codon:yes stop_codon:yes gene_type:complete
MNSFQIKSPLFGLSVQFFVGEFDKSEFIATMVKLDPAFNEISLDIDVAEAHGKCWDCGHNQIIWLENDSVAVAAHEIVHAAFGTAASIGFDSDESSQEYHAYFTQWALSEFLINT